MKIRGKSNGGVTITLTSIETDTLLRLIDEAQRHALPVREQRLADEFKGNVPYAREFAARSW